MKELDVFHVMYKELLKQGKGRVDAFALATDAQYAFDKYIAEQVEASLRPHPSLIAHMEALKVDTGGIAETIIVPLSTFQQDQPESAESFYWKPIQEYNISDDALICSRGYFLTKVGEDDLCFYQSLDNCPKSAKYLARKPKAFVPCWEWDGKQSPVDSIWIRQDFYGFWFRYDKGNGSGASSAFFPTLEAAQLEAERYYKLYAEPNLKK